MASAQSSSNNEFGSSSDRRAHRRRAVQLGTAWSDGRRARHGEVLDTSEFGLFLKPGWTPSESFLRGDTIELRCRVHDEDFELKGEVCWVGHSADHNVDGIGLRIVNTDAFARLIADLRPA
jgi:hypothetical protein